MAKRTFGWTRQERDPRDHLYQVSRHVAVNLPSSVSLVSGMGPQLNQDQLGSCGPNTADECITFDQQAEGMPVGQCSRLYVYYNTRYLMGTIRSDSGVDNRTMLKALANWGYCPEAQWPYDEGKYTLKPPAACYTTGAANRISAYAAVAKALAVMQGTLVSRRTFVFGFDCFDQIMSDAAAANGILTDPPAGASSVGGHDVTICGYNATGGSLPGQKAGNVWPAGTFIFRNHWLNDDGTPWGDNGYGYISFAYASGAHADDFWVISAVPKTQATRGWPFGPGRPWGPGGGMGGLIPDIIGGLIGGGGAYPTPGGYPYYPQPGYPVPGGYPYPYYPGRRLTHEEGPFGPHPFPGPFGPHPWGPFGPGGYVPGGYEPYPVPVAPGVYPYAPPAAPGYYPAGYEQWASDPGALAAMGQAYSLGIPWGQILAALAQGGVQALLVLIQSLQPQPVPVPVPVPVPPPPSAH